MDRPELGFGLMRLPLKDKNDRTSVDFEKTCLLVDTFLQNGGRCFDTACKYHGGESESAVRNCISSCYGRDSYFLANKITLDFVKRPEDQPDFVRSQLKKCGVSFFDRYLIHSLGPMRYPKAEAFKTFSFLCQLKQEGIAREIGFSFHGDAASLDRILSEHPEVDLVQLQINYIDWNDPVVEAEKCWKVAIRHQKKISVMEPLKGGLVTCRMSAPDCDLIDLALRFVAEKENVVTILSGMNEPEQIVQNLQILRSPFPLRQDEKLKLQAIVEEFVRINGVPCSGCGYCLETCPKGVAIPSYFALYNQLRAMDNQNAMNARIYYKNIASTHGKASACVQCGRCERTCPQSIPIREVLKSIVLLFER